MYGCTVLSASGLHTWRCLVSLALNVLRTRHHTALCGDNWDDGCPDKISVTMVATPGALWRDQECIKFGIQKCKIYVPGVQDE